MLFLVKESVWRGTVRAWDHAQLVHQQWLFAAIHNISLFIIRVESKDSIADLPSREVILFSLVPMSSFFVIAFGCA